MVACGSGRSSRGDDDDDDDSAANDDDAASDDDDAASDDDDAASNGEEECLQLGDQQGCVVCMQDLYPDGFELYLTYIVAYVYCGNQCGQVCADFCADPVKSTPLQSCDQCAAEITLEDPDGQDFMVACSQDIGCESYFLGSQACFQ
jgi:hypothetical protein